MDSKELALVRGFRLFLRLRLSADAVPNRNISEIIIPDHWQGCSA